MVFIVACQPTPTPTATLRPTDEPTVEEPAEVETEEPTEAADLETEEAAEVETEEPGEVATDEADTEADATEVAMVGEDEEAATEAAEEDEADATEVAEADVTEEAAEDEEEAEATEEGAEATALPSGDAEAAAAWTCPEGFEGQTLSVFNWSTYIAEDTVANFEEACGVTVQYDVYDSNESLLARLRQGNPGYDIAVPTDSYVAIMIGEDLLEPIDLDNIPNAANVSENLLDPSYDPGNQYSLPYQWGTVGVGYNQEVVGEEITSWEQVWNYEGEVAWLEDVRAMLGIALNNLGYDPNTDNPDEIAEARDYLMENGGNVVAIATDDGQAQLERGDVDIVIEYSGDIFQLIGSEGGEAFAFAIPEEGSQAWVDNMVIPAGAPNHALAEVWMDYILDPQVSADIANYTAYATPNQAAIDQGLIDEAYLSSPIIYPDAATLEGLFTITAVPEAEVEYNNAWDEIKVQLGQ
jgi:spermidine/putrescine transport system substrate-binding protein